jgi:alkanesulfonate monooxygenase SsuD/methylene tetrahydromethanopterin reductase-like flavin-dependent oxidoreductase (luciferase family)
LRNAVPVTRQAVTLERLSEGRLVLGVGVGWLEHEFAAVGVPYRERGRRTDEAIAVLKASEPHPPLWIGGRSDAALRRAARVGDAWHPSHLTIDELRARIPELRAACERAERAADDVAVTTRRKLVRAEPGPSDDPDRVLRGDPGAIAATVAELEDVGVAHLIVEIPGRSEAELLENLDWFGREVLPEVHRG